jgi:hypothetical protein
MNTFQRVLRKIKIEKEQSEREKRKFAEFVFEVWRERYLIAHYEAIRCDYKLRQRQLESKLDADWSNCAALILEFCSLEIQDTFLRSSRQRKDLMVKAVFEDGGLYDYRNHWVELPVL